MEMNSTLLTRIAGVTLLIAFIFNLYIGLYDSVITQYNMSHYYLNWLITVVSLVGGLALIAMPKNRALVLLGGVVWPIVYVLGLILDVSTKLCLGAGSSADCWPSTSAAFDYLILNQKVIPNATGYGWQLSIPAMPIIIAMLAITFVLSLVAFVSLGKKPKAPIQQAKPPAKEGPTAAQNAGLQSAQDKPSV